MKRSLSTNIRRRLELLDSSVLTDVDAVRRPLLVKFIEQSLPLTATETVEYKKQIAARETSAVAVMMTEYQRMGYDEGIAKAERKG
ncbi:MAG: hypothetical protein H7Y38_08215 [Armatimonadetes bacterium]|nr:hypothetical protein [Armatimonadota bacterium]